jgi:hypothetical protein
MMTFDVKVAVEKAGQVKVEIGSRGGTEVYNGA